MPDRRRSTRPLTSGRVTSMRVASWTAPLSSAIRAWNLGNAAYPTPPPSRKQPRMSSSTSASSPTYWACTARLSGPAARVSHAACAGGSVKVIAAGSWSTMRPAGHRRQPFPHVAFVQPGNLGDPSAGGRRQRGHRVEQAATVTDADHQRQHARVQHVQHPLGELRRSGQARLLGHGHPPSTPATRRPPRRPENGSRLPKILRSTGP